MPRGDVSTTTAYSTFSNRPTSFASLNHFPFLKSASIRATVLFSQALLCTSKNWADTENIRREDHWIFIALPEETERYAAMRCFII